MNITSCSVKVMRSYDYCHFEVSLSMDLPPTLPHESVISQADELRKTAARLADHAVKQYIRRKRALSVAGNWETKDLKAKVEKIRQKPDAEWSPEEKAEVKLLGDIQHEARYDYDYPDRDDDGDDDE